MANGHDNHVQPPAAAAGTSSKKGKQKKPVDSNEATKLLQARISQLEQNAAEEKDLDAEMGGPTVLTQFMVPEISLTEGVCRTRGEEGEPRPGTACGEDGHHAED
jgi:hypothetical protein